jgi:hypothetical protein
VRELWQPGGAGTRLLVGECDCGAAFAGNPTLAVHGLSILLVEQNAILAFEATQRCLVMENGRAVPSGTAAELRHSSDIRRIYLGVCYVLEPGGTGPSCAPEK